MRKTNLLEETLAWFHRTALLSSDEARFVDGLFSPYFEFAEAIRLADSIHLHLRVDDTDALPSDEFARQDGVLDHGHPGYVKYRFPEGVNAIFSSIPVAQDNFAETPENRRPRPHLDHIGIDLRREEEEEVRAEFDRLPERAAALGWGHIPQGGNGRPVYCCHIEVEAKHWIYPPDGAGHRSIPLEFAYGPLKINDESVGCDLRPSSPVIHLAEGVKNSCCC